MYIHVIHIHSLLNALEVDFEDILNHLLWQYHKIHL